MCKTVAIVTTYFPKDEVVQNIRKISAQVDVVFICDNSPDDNYDLFQEISNVKYLANRENLGLSRAFNKALKGNDYISLNSDDFVIFFDQDSQIEKGHVLTLKDEYKEVEIKHPDLGCLGPVFCNINTGRKELPKSKTKLSETTYQVGTIITSSMLTRYKNLRLVNFWNENLFLDMADWDICWRMQQAGLLCGMTEKVILTHSLGRGEKVVLGKHILLEPPIREYYQMRDSLY